MKVRLPHQSFEILAALLERPGDLVTRDELQRRLWPAETFVDFDGGLTTAVKKLREALGDSAETPRFVETLPKRGYRFIAAINGSGGPAAAVPAPSATPALASAIDAALPSPAGDAVARAPGAGAMPQAGRRAALLVAAVLFVVLAGALFLLDVGGWRDRLWEPADPQPVRSIAVLPLENLTGDPAQDGLVEAVTDSLTTELVRAGLLEVASRTSTAQFRGSRMGLPEIARRLEVDAVVEGTVARVGDRWLVNVQLIHGSSDRHVWAERYETARGEIATFPRRAAWDVLRAIPPYLDPPDGRGDARRRPANEEAYVAYVLGRHFVGVKTLPNASKAIDYFERAIAADPGYAPAYSGLSDAWRQRSRSGLREESLAKAEAAARKAIALDGNLAEAHTSLGGVLWRHWKWDEAEAELKRALDLDPEYAEGHRVYGMFLVMIRRHEEAVAALRRAHELDGLSPVISAEYALSLMMAGHEDEATRQFAQVREINPRNGVAHQGLAYVRARRGDWTGAIEALEENPAFTIAQSTLPWLGFYYAKVGRRADALRVLKNIETEYGDEGHRAVASGIVHLGLGDREQALDLIETGTREVRSDVTITNILYDFLKDEPRYQALLREMGLDITS